MAVRCTLFAGLLGLQILPGVAVDVVPDVEDEALCLLQDATALLHDAMRREEDEPRRTEMASPRGALVEAIQMPAAAATSAFSSKGAGYGVKTGKGGTKSKTGSGDEEDELGDPEESEEEAGKTKTTEVPVTNDSETPRLAVLAGVLLVPFAGLLTYILSKLGFMGRDPNFQDDPSPRSGGCDAERRKNENMAEDTYSFAVASLVRDAQRLSQGHPKSHLFISRCIFAVALLMGTIFIQAGLVVQVKMFVTPQQVNAIREAYDAYELHMYGGESHTSLTVNGKHRGIPGYFKPERFATLDDDLKGEVCNIPFSQLSFFGLVLAVWTLTCMVQIRRAWCMFFNLIVVTPTIGSMSECLMAVDTSDEDAHERHGDRLETMCPTATLKKTDVQYLYGDNVVICGLTAMVKSAIVMFVVMPWVFITGYLLWLGSRWLAATNDYGNLISNAVALEFILYLKDLVYSGLVSERNKRELEKTKILPDSKRQRAGYQVYLGTFVWALLVVAWLWGYIFHFQAVLPEYRWDVKEVCGDWYAELLARPA